jgi:hypothetical protein
MIGDALRREATEAPAGKVEQRSAGLVQIARHRIIINGDSRSSSQRLTAAFESTIRKKKTPETIKISGVGRPEGHASENSEFKNAFGILDVFPFRLRGDELVLGTLEPIIPRPARVAQELALALELQAEIDREGLTYRELADRHRWSRMKACRLLPLTRLAPDIQTEVGQLTTTVAGEPIDRDTSLWIPEVPDWVAQRARFDALTRTWRALFEPREELA